jgi:hypothetical protein
MERYNQYKGMDFGKWDKKFNQLEWIKYAIPKLKDGSNIIIFNSWQNLKLISDELEENGCSTKRILVVKKTNPMPVNRDRLFVNSFEFMIYATKGGKWTFNRRFDYYETGFFECKNNGETKHPTEKQVKTMKELITILTNKGQTVLDPFMGSGTTGVACKELGREFIGIEKEQEYIKIAEKRINKGKVPEILKQGGSSMSLEQQLERIAKGVEDLVKLVKPAVSTPTATQVKQEAAKTPETEAKPAAKKAKTKKVKPFDYKKRMDEIANKISGFYNDPAKTNETFAELMKQFKKSYPQYQTVLDAAEKDQKEVLELVEGFIKKRGIK